MPTDLPPRRVPSPGHPPTPGRFERGFTALVLVAVFGLLTASLVDHWQPVMWSVPIFLAAWLPLIALHEAGHALTAHLLGWRVHRVVVGGGPRLFARRFGGVPVTLHALPLYGYVSTTPREMAGVRWKRALIYFMGPGIELLFVAVIALVVGPASLLHREPGLAHLAVQAIAAAAFIQAVFNLLPIPGGALDTFGAPDGPSDGMGIVHSFVLPREVFARQIGDLDDDDA